MTPRIALALAALLVTACSSVTTPSPSADRTTAVPLKVGLGYIPSVQFAPFYVAQQQGRYRAAGLDVTFDNQIDPELIKLVGLGTFDLGIGDGTSLIPAVAQGIPIRYVATIYAQFPNVVVARADANVAKPADLAGKKLGTPGKYGSSWIMLQALLRSAGLTTEDVEVVLYPDFGQAGALAAGAVQSITGFVNNEPIVLAKQNVATTTLAVDQITPLPGPGLVAGTATLAAKREQIRAFIRVTLQAMAEIKANPQLGIDATFATAPDLATDPAGQRAILDATIKVWSDAAGTRAYGAIDASAWAASVAFMRTLPDAGVTKDIPTDQLIDASLLPTR